LSFVEKGIRHDDGGGDPLLFQGDRIVHTARGAGTSITNGRDDRIVFRGNLPDQFRGSVF
jgi:hypothetical protein